MSRFGIAVEEEIVGEIRIGWIIIEVIGTVMRKCQSSISSWESAANVVQR